MKRYAVNEVIKVKVTGVTSFGIFVEKDQFKGLIHISEVSKEFVRDINDYVKVGEEIYAKILEIDVLEKQLKLSIKDIDYANTGIERDLIDSSVGFEKLKENLPIWIEEKLTELKKEGQ